MQNMEEMIHAIGTALGAKDLTLEFVLRVTALLLVGWLVIRFLMGIVDRLLARSRLSAAGKGYIRSAVRLLLWFLVALMLAETLGIKATSIIAMLSVAGLAISLAMQNTLANLAGGLVLLVTKPFAIGDFVEVDGVSGTIAAVNMAYTAFVTPDNKEIFVPNSELSATKIINYNRLGRRRMDLKFRVSYDIPTERVRAALLDAMAAVPGILEDPAPAVYISEYQPSGIEYLARLWTPSGDYWTIHFALMEGVRESFARYGVRMTHDHLNVHIVEK